MKNPPPFVPELLDHLLAGDRAAGDHLPVPRQGRDGGVGEALHDAPGDQQQGTHERDRQQDAQRPPGQVDPEVAQRAGADPDEAADQGDRDRHPHRRGQEVLDGEAGHLDREAQRRLAAVRLPVGVGDERRRGVERHPERHVGQVTAHRQVALAAACRAIRTTTPTAENATTLTAYDRELCSTSGVDARQAVDAALDAQVPRAVVDAGHVVAQRAIGDRQREHHRGDRQQAGDGVGH